MTEQGTFAFADAKPKQGEAPVAAVKKRRGRRSKLVETDPAVPRMSVHVRRARVLELIGMLEQLPREDQRYIAGLFA